MRIRCLVLVAGSACAHVDAPAADATTALVEQALADAWRDRPAGAREAVVCVATPWQVAPASSLVRARAESAGVGARFVPAAECGHAPHRGRVHVPTDQGAWSFDVQRVERFGRCGVVTGAYGYDVKAAVEETSSAYVVDGAGAWSRTGVARVDVASPSLDRAARAALCDVAAPAAGVTRVPTLPSSKRPSATRYELRTGGTRLRARKRKRPPPRWTSWPQPVVKCVWSNDTPVVVERDGHGERGKG